MTGKNQIETTLRHLGLLSWVIVAGGALLSYYAVEYSELSLQIIGAGMLLFFYSYFLGPATLTQFRGYEIAPKWMFIPIILFSLIALPLCVQFTTGLAISSLNTLWQFCISLSLTGIAVAGTVLIVRK